MKVFCFPIRYQNKFIQINTEILKSLEYEVLPLKDVYKLHNLLDVNKIVVLNWIEDQPYLKVYGFLKSWIYFFYYFLTIIVCKITSSKIIWIKHNFKPHSKSKFAVRHKLTCLLMRTLKLKETTLESYVGEHFLPHPLYLDDKEILSLDNKIVDNNVGVVFFGHVKKYKGLHNVLKNWPSDLSLKISGQFETNDYKNELQEIIKTRNLKVTINDCFLSEFELEELLLSNSHVLIPHESNSMISSGSFYHAISYGCNILAVNSEFAFHKSKTHNFVTVFDVEKINMDDLVSSRKNRTLVIKDSLAYYSREKLKRSWMNLLND